MNKTYLATLILVAFGLALALYFQETLPDSIATHWNAAGEADTYGSPATLFILPAIAGALSLLLIALPRIDPLENNISSFKRYYDMFIFVFVLFMLYIQALSIAWNYISFDMLRMMVPAFAGLFYYIGVMLGHAKQNWFVGIRTPWTLSSETVWDKTHALGAKLFMASAVITLAGLIGYTLWFVLVPVVVSSIACLAYSYFVWRGAQAHA